MKIQEIQAKQLLAQYGVAVPPGDVCFTPEEARKIAEKLFASGEKVVVIKAQIHAGGRGKGTFKSGFKGGVKLSQSADEVYADASAMLGNVLVTKQTSTEGGMDIEEVAAKTPEKILKEAIDPAVGMMPYQARKVCSALGLRGDLIG